MGVLEGYCVENQGAISCNNNYMLPKINNKLKRQKFPHPKVHLTIFVIYCHLEPLANDYEKMSTHIS
jgi:hypothetical protein